MELWEARIDPTELDKRANNQGLERLTLHNKIILIDRHYLLAGSLNLDPRSVEINTELGMIIDSTELAGHLTNLA